MVSRKLTVVLAMALLTGCASQGGLQGASKDEAHKQWNTARSSVLYGLAKQQYDNGSFGEARKSLDQALTLNSENPQLHILMARLMIEQGQLEPADKELQTAKALDPKNAEVDYLCGVVYQRWQKLEAALDCYQKAFEKQPTELAYLLAQAETLVALDRVTDALDLLQGKLAYFENSPIIRDAVGQLLVQQGRYADGAAALRQASILGPDEPTIREHLALALFYAREYREAEVQLDRLLKDEKYSSRSDLVMALGECQFQAGRMLDARSTFETASQLDPSSAAVWLNLTKVALRLNDTRRADLAVRKALALEAQNSEAYLLLGYLRMNQDRLPEALTAFRKASSLDPQDPTSLSMAGLTLEKQGQHAQAIACYGQALKLKPGDELASTLMAQAHE
ncbi:MAG TPA: tetratricopeptide repeat protein [Tepidisphaeraceae bacterium]|nr:tetratricopeptide repeat protein [Tepidisphaeraceae bacterium]